MTFKKMIHAVCFCIFVKIPCMKTLVAYRSKILPCLLVLYSSITMAQHSTSTSSSEYYNNYYTGCWQTKDTADGYLVTQNDHTFQWTRPANKPGALPDTLYGSWRIKAVYSIPKKTTVMVLKFRNGQRKQYSIGVTSLPATIYLPNGAEFHKVPCKK